MSAMALYTPTTTASAAAQVQVGQAYGQLPMSFAANQGQTDAHVNFVSRGAGYALFLTPTEAVLDLNQGSGVAGTGTAESVLSMQLVGASPSAPAVGVDQQSGVTNYLIGDDPSEWVTNVPSYAQVEYANVYAGVNLVYYGNDQQHLEYDFVLAPGASANVIQLSFQGSEGVALDTQGDLVVHTLGGDVVEQAPVVYQTVNGAREAVSGRYVLEGNGQVGFHVGAYDATQPLVIDPTYSLVYSTYLGGKQDDRGYAIAVDGSGDAYVAGLTDSANFPTKNPLQAHDSGDYDVFVTKLNAAGTGLVYSTFLGGTAAEWAKGIAVNSAGDAYVTGWTQSTDFPTKNALQSKLDGTQDGFVSELNASGTALVYSTYLGGSSQDQGSGIAVDSTGQAYVTGWTESTNFPTTATAFQPSDLSGGTEAFVTKLDPTKVGLSSLVYSTYLGTSGGGGVGNGIAVDSSGYAYVTGRSLVPTTVGAYQTAGNEFVAKLNTGGTGVIYSTELGAVGADANGIAVDSSGDAFVTGWTDAVVPTTTGAFQGSKVGQVNAFMTELNATGSGLVYSTYLGGSGSTYGDGGQSIAVDVSGHVYITGYTYSSNFPTVNAFQPAPTLNNGGAAFVAEFDPGLTGPASLVYSSYLGGGDNVTIGEGIAVDVNGNAYVTGYTSGNFTTTTGVFQTQPGATKNNGTDDAFVTKIGLLPVPLTIATRIGSTAPLGTRPASLVGPAAVVAAPGAGARSVAAFTWDDAGNRVTARFHRGKQVAAVGYRSRGGKAVDRTLPAEALKGSLAPRIHAVITGATVRL